MLAQVFSCAVIGPEVAHHSTTVEVVTVSRAQGTLTFPANFTLVAAMNPCPCGVQIRRLSWSGCCAWLDLGGAGGSSQALLTKDRGVCSS